MIDKRLITIQGCLESYLFQAEHTKLTHRERNWKIIHLLDMIKAWQVEDEMSRPVNLCEYVEIDTDAIPF